MATQRTVELLKKSAVATTLAAEIENNLGKIIWYPIGDFGTEFTINDRNQVGFDVATKTYWAWLGELPHAVLAADTPNTTEWRNMTQETLSALLANPAESGNRVARMPIVVDSIIDLLNVPFIAGRTYIVNGIYPNSNVGGGMFVAKANYDLTENNGGIVSSKAAIQAWYDAAVAAGGATTANLQANLNIWFTTGAGAGDAFVRVDSKEIDVHSFGYADGFDNELSAVQLNDVSRLKSFPTDTETNLDQKVLSGLISGGGTLKNTNDDRSIALVDDDHTFLYRMTFGPMGDHVLGNEASALSFRGGSNNASSVFSKYVDCATAIRIGWTIDEPNTQAKDALALGNYIQGADGFGIENILCKYPRIIANSINNNGAKIGSHGIRLTGNETLGVPLYGAILSANSIRDRNAPAISTQPFSESASGAANYVENCNNIIRDTGQSEVFKSHAAFSALAGRRLSEEAIRQQRVEFSRMTGVIHDGDSDAIRIGVESKFHRMDFVASKISGNGIYIESTASHCFITAILDEVSGTPVRVYGSNNIIDVIVGDECTGTNSILVDGDNNILRIIDSGSPSGNNVDIGGNNNILVASTTNNVRVDGDDNQLTANVNGDLIVTGENNKFTGSLLGALTLTGLDNDFSRMKGLSASGNSTLTTNSSGVAFVTHGLKLAPRKYNITIKNDTPLIYSVIVANSTTLQVKIWDAGGTAYSSSSVDVFWKAEV